MEEKENKGNFIALTPLFVFLGIYLLGSLVIGDFYKIPITIAFIISSTTAIAMAHGSLQDRIKNFSLGASDKNILLMVWIFILAGAFAQSAKAMGAVDATVNLTLHILPDNLLLLGIFLAACFVSLAVGTSVGTIVALVPVAAGIAEHTGVQLPLLVAIVVGGALFGDNLSFISDTTIAATQTQGCRMKDKFKVNILIVLPAALIACGLYIFLGIKNVESVDLVKVDWLRVIPYITVIALALAGLNVMLVLIAGIIICGLIGIITNGFDIWTYIASMGEGIKGMGELIIVTLLAGGMLEMIHRNGGIEYIIHCLTGKMKSKRAAEFGIATLVSLANLCTANNTVAIITTGKIARNISIRFNIDSRKTASILDTFSCFIQGIIPYGAQLLMASQLADISPISIIGYLYYPFLIGIFGILSILFRYPKRYS